MSGRRGAWVPIAIATAIVAAVAIRRILVKVGHPGAALDDAYIHFQYARAIAEGHPFRYAAGEAPSSGATSLLWPALLAPFWAIGLRDDAILWPAWALSFVALGALAWEAKQIARAIGGEVAGYGAAAMVIAFPALAWCAASGMEVVPFAWLLARSVRRAAEWAEDPRERTRQRATELVALAYGATLVRPEGALAALAIAATIALHPGAPTWRARAMALAPLAAIALPPLILFVATGEAASTTALVKLLPGNPYYRGPALAAAIGANARLLAGTILDGEVYSAEFMPSGGAWLAMIALASLAFTRAERRWRALLVIGLALAMFAPCAYATFLWNRLRYLWPFATGWLVALACFGARVGEAAARAYGSRARVVGGLACGAMAGALLSHMGWTLDDVAQSASGIDRQQVALGRWAKDALPRGARIGVNDTGAIAYFGDHPTFDVVGLTTRGEGKYWVAGAGSRLEHYERLHARDPRALPTHFVVYPEWFACDALLGAALREATVTDSSILGGQTMRAYVADYSLLGSGEAPWTSGAGDVVDAVDVADLESEAAHEYALLGAREGEEVAGYGPAADGRPVVDGGRTHRTRERFVAHLPPGRAIRAIARVEAASPVHARVAADGRELASFAIDESGWTEIAFDVPADAARATTRFELAVDDGALTVFHYWLTTPESARSDTSP